MKNTSTGGDFCCDFGWQKGAATTESSHLLQLTNVPNIPLKSFVFQPIDPPQVLLRKHEEKEARKLPETSPTTLFFSTTLWLFRYRVLNEARTSPNLQSKLEKHAPNVSFYGPSFTILILGENT
uniref:Uncharacterized protein n=1 Tax=Lactuca sativa TaxID=4236 RepID=A0A9R1V353_LACSA|nr:hypothetical protein LSAT_V11C600312720 [Lactuca sativa]